MACIGVCVSIPSVFETPQASYVYLVYFEMSLGIFPTALELGDKSSHIWSFRFICNF